MTTDSDRSPVRVLRVQLKRVLRGGREERASLPPRHHHVVLVPVQVGDHANLQAAPIGQRKQGRSTVSHVTTVYMCSFSIYDLVLKILDVLL